MRTVALTWLAALVAMSPNARAGNDLTARVYSVDMKTREIALVGGPTYFVQPNSGLAAIDRGDTVRLRIAEQNGMPVVDKVTRLPESDFPEY